MRFNARRPTKYQISSPPIAMMLSAKISARCTTARKRSGSPRSRPTSTIIWLGRREMSAIAACLVSVVVGGASSSLTFGARPLDDAFAVALVGEWLFGPAFCLEHAGFQAFDVAGQDTAVGVGDQVEIGAWLA